MDYEVGVRLDAILQNQEKQLKAIEWILTALADHDMAPKELKEEPISELEK